MDCLIFFLLKKYSYLKYIGNISSSFTHVYVYSAYFYTAIGNTQVNFPIIAYGVRLLELSVFRD